MQRMRKKELNVKEGRYSLKLFISVRIVTVHYQFTGALNEELLETSYNELEIYQD